MKVIKKINNNFAVAVDESGAPIIISGVGVGFGTPYELKDLTKVKRSYYSIDPRFIGLLESLNEEVVEAADKIVVFAEKKLKMQLNPNLTFSLADHLEFALKRVKDGNVFNYGITFEMEHLHAKEMEIAKDAIVYLNKKFKMAFPKSELAAIAMHILEAENFTESRKNSFENNDQLYDKIAEMIKKELNIEVNMNDFNYYRFITHMQYLLNRKNDNQEISSENRELFETIKNQYQDAYRLAIEIKEHIQDVYEFVIGDEEIMYLMLHINRLKSKQK